MTVSIGVAALDSGSKRELSELLAAADAALYRAKAGGRDQVQMISTTRGLSAISGPGIARRAATQRPTGPAERIPTRQSSVTHRPFLRGLRQSWADRAYAVRSVTLASAG